MANEQMSDECTYPIEQIKKVHDYVREEGPEEPTEGNTTEKLMTPRTSGSENE